MTLKKNKSLGIQYLRAAACIMVFLSQFIGMIPDNVRLDRMALNYTPLRLLWSGESAVIIFFVLSGFFIYKNDEKMTAGNYIKKIYRRIKRMYPAFAVVMLLGIAARYTFIKFDDGIISGWGAGFWNDNASLKQILMQFAVIAPINLNLVNPVVWTIRIELWMIFILPAVNYLLNKFKSVSGSVIIFALSFATSFISCFAYLPMFVIGMIAKKHFGNGVCIKNKKIICALAALSVIFLDIDYIFIWIGVKLPWYIVRNTVAVGAAILAVILFKVSKKFSVLLWIGDNSFLIYLVHMVVLLWFRFLPEYVPYTLYGAVCIATTVVIVEAVKFFEKRINMLIDMIEIKILDKVKKCRN